MRTIVTLRLAWTGAAALFLAACDKKTEAPPPPPPEVKVAEVLQRDVPIYVGAIGQTRGNAEIEIRARVEGFVESVDFKEGTTVKKDQLLYTIDPRPFQASLAQAKGAEAEAKAQLVRTQQDVLRYRPLVEQNAISRQEYETAVALEKAAQGMLEAAEATVRRADVDLGYTKVLAPENGLIAKTEVFAGTLVGRGQSTLLTRISRIDPIHARFSVPERDYLAYSRKNKEAGRETDDKADKFELLLADGTVHAHKGHLVFVDSSVDPVTGTILIEASFPNPGDLIRPGAYCRVRAAIETKKGAILVPQRCVQELQGVFSVAAVGTDGSVNLRMVKPSERIGSLWVIDSGLKAGDRVIVEGAQKVRPGAKVNATLVPIEEGSTAPKGAAPPGGGGTDEKKSTPEK